MRPLLVALAVAVALPLACGRPGLPGAPPTLEALLAAMPASAVPRGLFFSAAPDGFGSLLGVADLSAGLGLAPDAVTAVLESGEPPVTALAGTFDADALAERFRDLGYSVTAEGEWLVAERDGASVGAPAVVAAVPAAGWRDGTLVLGSSDEVRAVLAGAVAADLEWLPRVARALGPSTSAAALGPPPDVTSRAARAGVDVAELLARAGVETALAPYRGFAIGGPPGGVVALAYDPPAGGADEAAALALRLATASVLDHPGRRTTDALEPGAPRWRAEADLVVLPVEWTDFDAARLRGDLGSVALPWLVPLDS